MHALAQVMHYSLRKGQLYVLCNGDGQGLMVRDLIISSVINHHLLKASSYIYQMKRQAWSID